MSVYLVALVEPDDDVWSRIEAEWPENHYRLAETLAMVSIPSNGVSTPSSVAERIGFDDAQGRLGMVLKMDYSNAYGWLPAVAVDWFKTAAASK